MRIKVDNNKRNLIRSGGYVGSIGAGGFEFRPDGKAYRSRIFNNWNPEDSELLVFIYTNEEIMKVLSIDDLILPSRVINSVKKINYEYEFPITKMSFDEIPVSIEFISFFIPQDIKNSSLPAVLIKVKGKGKLLMMLSVPEKSKGSALENKVSIKNSNGEIILISEKTKSSFVINQGYCGPFRNINQKTAEGKISAGFNWSGDFEDEIRISWYFPYMYDMDGNFLGHYYTNYFNSSGQVSEYVKKNKKKLLNSTMKFKDSIYKLKIHGYLKDSYSAQLSTFVKQSWLAKNGNFGVWEGSSCCCGLQTTDVAFYGSWLYAGLFPELEKKAITLTASFQRKDGWIPHFFPGTFKRIDEYRRKDMNMQFVLMAVRDYIITRDIELLKYIYPSIKKAIKLVYKWDINNDGIPDVEGPDQTFDAWTWKGATIYFGSLWLASLKFASFAANILHDKNFETECIKSMEIVKKSIIKKLWNGKYFVLSNYNNKIDSGCLIDAFPGEWYSYLCGFGFLLSPDMIKSHLKTCLSLNRKKTADYMNVYRTEGEDGICYINCGYPDNRKICYQQYEFWTGLEYAFALNLYIAGLKREALKVIYDVYSRKKICGMLFNHIECGGDYFRPMVIGALKEVIDGKLPYKKDV